MSQFKFFDDAQMAAESSGKQFDKNGKPLVGRYPDGSTPKGDKKAYGVAQMQVGTARATAKQFGIEWDERRFFNDANYNRTLGDKHMEHLTRKYGDRSIATAAYHQGEPTVDRAIEKYGRANYLRGVGPEGRKYVKKIAAARGGKGMSGTQDFFDGLESKLAPEVEASQGIRANASAIFGSDQRLNTENAAVRQGLGEQKQALNVLDVAQTAAQEAQLGAMTRQVEETRAISDTIVAGEQELRRQIKPVFETRQKIADQLDRINTMNPLEQKLRGMFDYNYDRDYMTQQLDNFDRTLKMRQDDFQYLNDLNRVALGEVSRRYGLDTAMSDLVAKQAGEDLHLVGLTLANTAGFLNATQDEISTQASVINAKLGASRTMLGQLDSITMNNLMVEAQNNGGVVTHGGVELSYAQLREALQGKEQQELAFENFKLGIAANRQDLAEKSIENAIRYASKDQIEGWINNGGTITMPDGTTAQAPMDKLSHYLGVHLNLEEAQAEQIAQNLPGAQALKFASDLGQADVQLFMRGQKFFTPGSPDDKHMAQMFRGQSAAIRELIAAEAAGKPPATIRVLAAKVQQASTQIRAKMDDTILRSVGGDKQSAAYVGAFVYGTPLSEGEAASAMVHFAMKGGLPEQMTATPEVKQLFNEVQKSVARNRIVDGKPRSEAQLKQIVIDEVLRTAQQTVGQAQFLRVYDSLPSEARKDGHPFGKLSQEQWGRIRVRAEVQAARAVSTEAKMNPDDILKMARTGKPLSSAPAHQDMWKRFSTNFADAYNQNEQRVLVEELDALPAVSPGLANSEALTDYIRSQSYGKRVNQYSQAASQGSFGDFVMAPLTRNSLGAISNEFANNFDTSQDAFYQTQRQSAKSFDNAYGRDPVNRAVHILSSIEGVGKAGALALKPFLLEQAKRPEIAATQKQAAAATRGFLSGMFEMPSRPLVIKQEQTFKTALANAKFDNPQLEAYRKKAVAGFDQSATQTQTFLEALGWSRDPEGEQ